MDVEGRGTELEASRHENQRFRALVAMAPVGMFETDADGRCVFVNERWCEIAGMTVEEALGEGWTGAIHPEDRDRVFAEWSRSASEQVPFNLEYRFRRPDGGETWVLGRASALRGTDGQTRGHVGTITDITERRRMDDVLCAQTRLADWAKQSAAELALTTAELGIFAALVASSSDAIAVARPDGEVRHANLAFRKLFEQDEGSSARTLFEVLGLDHHAASALRGVLANGERYQGMSLLTRRRGEVMRAAIDCYAIRDAGSSDAGIAVLVRDLTWQHRAEQERAELQAQVIAAQEAAIRELSTPLLPIAAHVIAIPLVGAMNRARAEQILDTLLEGIGRHQAEVAILDITGVRTVDTHVADVLLRSARAGRLLGTDVVLTGVSPAIAQTLIGLGVGFSGLRTLGTLASGIAYALARERRTRTR